MAQAIEFFLEKAAHICNLISAYLIIPSAVLLIGADVVLRYGLSMPLPWAQEACGILLFVSLALALSSSWVKGMHVRMEMVYEMVPYRLQRCGDVLSGACGLVLFGMLGWQALLDIPYMRNVSERSEELGVLLWPFRLLLAIVSAMLFLQLLLFAARSALAVVRGEISHGKP